MNRNLAGLGVTVFDATSRLAAQHGAINLGQGFPDDPGPEDVRAKAAEAVLTGYNQYPPMMGLPELRRAVAAHYRAHQGLDLDPETEVMVTSGATEALAGALLALLNPGDEVVLFQPMYDAYLPLVRRAGGVPRFVTLQPPRWRFTEADLAAAFTERTRVVLLNSPLNPTGTVMGEDQLALLARFVERHDCVALCDEVWEHVVFEGAHRSLMSLPGMRERAIKVGSAGKIFGLTGWKVGFVAAAPRLMAGLARAHQFLTFTTPPNLQVAVAHGLGKSAASFEAMRLALERQRDRFTAGMAAIGLPCLPCEGTYFACADVSALAPDGDEAFCRRLVTERGVAAIPVSAFYAPEAEAGAPPVTSVARFCFAKRDAVIDAALSRLDGLARRAA